MTDAQEKYSIPENITLNKRTVESGLKPRKKLTVGGHGHVSPMVHIESYFLDVILQLAAMR